MNMEVLYFSLYERGIEPFHEWTSIINNTLVSIYVNQNVFYTALKYKCILLCVFVVKSKSYAFICHWRHNI